MEFDEVEKVYGVDPLTCPKCGSKMKIIAIIMDPTETEKILYTTTQYNWKTTKSLQHLVKIGRAPPGLGLTNLNN